MSQPYAELLDGATLVRRAPGPRHEVICARLHELVRASVTDDATALLLAPRTEVRLSSNHALRPDLALVTAATNKLWLAAEIVSSDDHQTDTVVKKQIYEEMRVPILWMIDPRYDNVEVYHASPYGLALKQILAGREILSEKSLPEFQVEVYSLFATRA